MDSSGKGLETSGAVVGDPELDEVRKCFRRVQQRARELHTGGKEKKPGRLLTPEAVIRRFEKLATSPTAKEASQITALKAFQELRFGKVQDIDNYMTASFEAISKRLSSVQEQLFSLIRPFFEAAVEEEVKRRIAEYVAQERTIHAI